MTPTLAIDLETYSSVDIKKSGMYKYVESPDFEIILIGVSVNGGEVEVFDPLDLPEDFIEYLNSPQYLKTAHNAPFEIACLEKHFDTTLDPSQWECTMAKGAQVGLPLSLDEMSKALGLDAKKDAKGKALIKYFCCPCKPTKANGMRTRNLPHHDPERWEAFIEYCRQDVVVEQAIRERISFFEFPEREKRIWLLDQKINRRGILLDPTLIGNAMAIDRTHADRLTAEAAALTGLDNPNSVAQLKEWLGTDSPLNKETMPALLKNAPDETTRRVLEIRQQLGKASIKKFAAMTNAACADNRVRGLHQYYGAWRTGRWAGRIVQPQNLAKNYLPDLDLARDLVRQGALDDVELCFGDVGDTLSQLIRTAFIADEGKHLAVCDFSAIEARVIAWLAGERWRLDVFNGHGKIYEASAAQMFKVPLESIDKGRENHHLRAKGKIAELALGFQGSVGALEKMGAVKMGLNKDELKPLVDMWRNANKKIVQLWYDADRAAIEAVDTLERVTLHHGISFQVRSDVLFITLPSGRRLAYQQPRIGPGKFGDVVTYMGQDQISKKWVRIESYGGKFVENLGQAIARDLLAESLLALDAAGFDIVMHVHDEVIAEGTQTAEAMGEIMGQPIPWAAGLPLRADGYETKYYCKRD